MFNLGQKVATRNAVNWSIDNEVDLTDLLIRHLNHDWGDLCAEDKALNDAALKTEGRVLSAYVVKGQKLYVVTEWDRSVTTVMLAEDY